MYTRRAMAIANVCVCMLVFKKVGRHNTVVGVRNKQSKSFACKVDCFYGSIRDARWHGLTIGLERGRAHAHMQTSTL